MGLLLGIHKDLSSQTLQNGCSSANFGVDADIYANTSHFGNSASNANQTDDWFQNSTSFSGNGLGVIDTTGAGYLKQQYQAGVNLPYVTNMSLPPNTITNGIRWQDATYARDYFGGSGAIDKTSFTSASKNGESPAVWDTGPHNVVPKNDLIDCYAHLRRDGVTADGLLWLFLGFSRISTTGDSYFDAELFAAPVSYNTTTQQFSDTGPDGGHTAWEFDASGNISRIGDLIVTASMSTNNAPEFELRIWVKKTDFQTVNPAGFTFGNNFNGANNGAQYGYADIVAPSGNSFGCALGNSGQTNAPPWGTLDGGGDYSEEYEANQFLEMGLNLTAFGIDPSIIPGMEVCDSPFSNVVFKTRSSNSFTAQLKDFSGPFPFGAIPYVPSSIVGGHLSCSVSEVTLTADSIAPGAFYTWQTPNGSTFTNVDASEIVVETPGMYILTAASIEGCQGLLDTFFVLVDTVPPAAFILDEPVYDCGTITNHLIAGETGMSYAWTGPNGFASTDQEIDVSTPGWYYLEVTSITNGCLAADSIYVLEFPCQDNVPDSAYTTTIIDEIPPDFTVPADISIDCAANYLDLTITGTVTDENDSCSPNIGEAIYTDQLLLDNACAGSTIFLRTWMLTDDCGNVNEQVQTITLIDTTPPTFTPPADITIDCNADFGNLTITGDVTDEADNCDPNIAEAEFTDVLLSDTPCSGASIIQRSWSLTDDCGNTSTFVQIISLQDTSPPIFSTPLDITISCDQNPTDLNITGNVWDEFDNCDMNIGEAVYTDVVEPADPCEGASSITRTWSLTDACGNATTQTQTIVLIDTIPPVFTGIPNNLFIECDDILVVGAEVSANDNCDINVIPIVLTQVAISGDCPDESIIIYTWTATDDCGNVSSTNQQTYIYDTESPFSLSFPDNITINCDELAAIPDPTDIQDNCDISLDVEFEEVYSDTLCSGSHTLTRIWTWADNCGNENEYVQEITIQDNVSPSFTAPADITIECDQNPEDLNITGGVTDEQDNCVQNTNEATFVDLVSDNNPCDGAKRIQRTWSLLDDCGNEVTAVQIITLEDTTAPTFTVPNDITIQCDLDPTDLSLTGEVLDESDNCTSNLTEASYEDLLTENSPCNGARSIQRTWRLSDACGNVNTQIQTITLIDTVAPLFVIPQDTIVYLDMACLVDTAANLLGTPTNIIDNCSNNFMISYQDDLTGLTECNETGSFIRLWTVTDACGNTNTGVQTIEVLDTIAPIFTVPSDALVYLDVNCQIDTASANTGDVLDAGDNCTTDVLINYEDLLEGLNACNRTGSFVRLWTVTDACGNTNTGVQTIAVLDTIAPVFTVPSDAVVYLNAQCDFDTTIADIGGVLDASDNCSIDLIIEYEDDVEGLAYCNGTGTFERQWIVTDACGNVNTGIQLVTMIDSIAPLFTVPPDVTIYLDAQCEIDTTIETLGDVLDATDNCSTAILIDFNDQKDSLNACSGTGVFFREWSVSDFCGNISTGVQTITVLDTLAPLFTIPLDTVVYLDAACELDTTTNTLGTILVANDNCSTTLSITYTDDLSGLTSCSGTGIFMRTWEVSDPCGNISTGVQTIRVLDTLAPLFTIPQDTVAYLDAACELDTTTNTLGTILVANDNCSTTLSITYTDNLSGLTSCNGTGVFTRTWEVSDPCGNINTGVQTITVLDTLAPSFVVPVDLTLECGQNFNDLILTGDAINEMDNCQSSLIEAVYVDSVTTDISCAGNQIIYRLWQLADACGNTQRKTQLITIKDTTAPLISGLSSDTTIYCGNIPAMVNPLVSDSCSAEVLLNFEENTVVGNCPNNFNIIRTWTAIDECGNEQVFVQTIRVIDTIAPVFLEIPQDLSVTCDSIPKAMELTASDDCDNLVDISFAENIIEGNCSGNYQIIRTWVAVDNCANESIATQTITVQDTVAPSFLTIPENLTVDCDAIPAPLVIELIDDCDSTATLVYEEIINEGYCMDFYTIIRQWTASDNCGNEKRISQEISVFNCGPAVNATVGPDNIICEHQPTSFSIEISEAYDTPSYQWQFSNDANSWSNIQGANTVIHNIDNASSEDAGWYRCLVANDIATIQDTLCNVISNQLQLMVLKLSPPVQFEAAFCPGDSIRVGTSVYYESGIYLDTLIATNGCDSFVQLNLNVYESYIVDLIDTICEGTTFYLGSNSYQETGRYSDTLQSIQGCDSIINLDLTVMPLSLDTVLLELCMGESFEEVSYFSDTTLVDTIVNVYGCIDHRIVKLMMLPQTVENINVSICSGALFDNVTYVTDTILVDTLQNTYGCDSIIVKHIEVSPTYSDTLDLSFCGEGIYMGVFYDKDTSFVDYFSSIANCDSVIVTNIQILPEYVDTIKVGLCYGGIYEGTTFYADTTWVESYTSSLGCDSTIVVDVIVPPAQTTNLQASICAGEDYLFGLNVLSTAGNYTEIFTGVNGCDSTVLLTLRVLDTYELDKHIDLCAGETYNGEIYIQDTILIDELYSINHCDSIVTTTIYVYPVEEEIQQVNLCFGQAYGGVFYDQDTMLVDRLQSMHGCDSTIVTLITLGAAFKDTLFVSLCEGSDYLGTPIFGDTLWTDEYLSSTACDSLVTTILNVLSPSETLLRDTICSGESYDFNGVSYEATGNYAVTLIGTNGCDSIVQLFLVVQEVYTQEILYDLCESESLNGMFFTQDTVWVDTFSSESGCDSTVRHSVVVHPSTTSTLAINLCFGQAYGGVLYDQDTMLVDRLQSVHGCDSIVTTMLSFLNEFKDTLTVNLCAGTIYENELYDQDTSWTSHYTSSENCDSFVYTQLFVHPVDLQDRLIALCPGDGILISDVYQTMPGVYTEVYTNENGCDSIINYEITTLSIFDETHTITICAGDSALIFNQWETEAGNYTQSFTSQNGCDSIVEMVLQVFEPSISFESRKLCPGEGMLINGVFVQAAGTYTDTISIGNSCDSIVQIELGFYPTYHQQVFVDICENDSLFLSGAWQFESGVFSDIFQTLSGCDSLITTTLVVHPSYEFVTDTTICAGESYFANGTWQTNSGIYRDVLTTVNNCDSILITNLIVLPSVATNIVVDLCYGESYFVQGALQNQSGIYFDTYENALGCDSIVQTEILIHVADQIDFNLILCEGDSAFIFGAYQTEAGFYSDTLQNSFGCDSVSTIVLTLIEASIELYQELSICKGDSILIGGVYQYSSGVFTDHYSSSSACDSVVITDLVVYEEIFLSGEDAMICEGEEVQLFLEGSATVELSWSPSNSLSCDDCLDPIAAPNETTTYTVSYFDECSGATKTLTVTVTIVELPLLNLQTEVEIIMGDSVLLSALSNDTTARISWYDNTGTMLCDSCNSIMVHPMSSTSYLIRAENDFGCPTEDVINLRVDDGCEFGYLEVSNVIFPQSGGYGDHLEILHEGVEIKNLRIFNRWGELVFETSDVTNKWDGTFRGKVLNPAVFVYYIQGNCLNDTQNTFLKVGNITLIH